MVPRLPAAHLRGRARARGGAFRGALGAPLRALRGRPFVRALSGSARAPGGLALTRPRARPDLELERALAAAARRARARAGLRLRAMLGRAAHGEARAGQLRRG